ncbi:unnamed protein product, partial [Laminaria digitata]
KAPVWADPALVLRSLVLLQEVLIRVPDAYVVPLRRRGVLHSIRNVLETSTPSSSTTVTVTTGPAAAAAAAAVAAAAAAAPPLLAGGAQQPSSSSPRPLGAAISTAIREIVDLCDAHQSLRAARSLSMGEGGGGSGGVGCGGAEAGVEAVDRLAATASTLREAVG